MQGIIKFGLHPPSYIGDGNSAYFKLGAAKLAEVLIILAGMNCHRVTVVTEQDKRGKFTCTVTMEDDVNFFRLGRELKLGGFRVKGDLQQISIRIANNAP